MLINTICFVNVHILEQINGALYTPQAYTRPKAQRAERMMRAHTNVVENLVVFAPLVLANE
jgi:uncharacterized MAPEG superfamily protein